MSFQLSYCGQMVREHDRDRFLTSLFAPKEVREDLWALFAFNHEIAKTREVVSDTTLGRIRLQWWREAIANIYTGGKVPDHAVVQGLARAIAAHQLPQESFDILIEAREFDLENIQPANIEGLLNYADFTSTPLWALAVQITGGDAEYEPVRPVAVNYALAGLLRAALFHAKQGRCYLPADLMKERGVTRDSLATHAKRAEVIRAVADHAVLDIHPGNRLLKAASALAYIYLKKIKNVDYDTFSPEMAVPPLFKEIRLLKALF